jgi:hypothetical protein
MSGKSGPPMAQFRPVLARIAYRFVALQVDFFQYRERRARGIIAWFLEVKKEIPCLSNQPVRRAVATLRPSAALCDGELGYCSVRSASIFSALRPTRNASRHAPCSW